MKKPSKSQQDAEALETARKEYARGRIAILNAWLGENIGATRERKRLNAILHGSAK